MGDLSRGRLPALAVISAQTDQLAHGIYVNGREEKVHRYGSRNRLIFAGLGATLL